MCVCKHRRKQTSLGNQGLSLRGRKFAHFSLTGRSRTSSPPRTWKTARKGDTTMKNGAAVVEQGQDGMLEMVQQGQEASGRGNPVLGRDREAPHPERDRVSVRQADPPPRLPLPAPTPPSPGLARPL